VKDKMEKYESRTDQRCPAHGVCFLNRSEVQFLM